MKNYFYSILAILIISIFGVWYFARNKIGSYIPKDENTIIVGTNAEFAPFTFIKNNEIVGFDIDVVKEVAHRLGKKVSIKDMGFDSLILEALSGQIQVIAAGMTCTPERQQKLFFTLPYIEEDPLVIISLAGKPAFHSVNELKGKNVLVNEGYTADFYMTNIPDVHLTRLGTVAEAYLALESGRADAFVSALTPLKPLFDKYGKDAFSINKIEGTSENCALAISKKYPELYEKIQGAIKEIIQDGTMQKIKTTWGLS